MDVDSLTVAEIKTGLKARGVYYSSKLRKQELRELLASSIHLPVLVDVPAQKQEKKKAGTKMHWRQDDPIHRLLYFEFKEGHIPLDPNEMGPAEIYCKYSTTEEFQGIKYNEHFVRCLKTLREKITKEEPLLKWNELHPARQLLFAEIEAGRIPIDGSEMGPAEVWVKYSSKPEFSMRGMKFNDTFKRRLGDLRKYISRDKDRAAEDKLLVARAIENHPPPTHNHRGEPQWNGSKAQELFKQDIADGKHLAMHATEPRAIYPREFKETRPEYQAFQLDTFRWKIRQEVRTNKYLHTLEHDAEQKLRKNLKKMTTGKGK